MDDIDNLSRAVVRGQVHYEHARAQMDLYGDMEAYREGYANFESSLRAGAPYINPYRYGTPDYTAFHAGYSAGWREDAAAREYEDDAD